MKQLMSRWWDAGLRLRLLSLVLFAALGGCAHHAPPPASASSAIQPKLTFLDPQGTISAAQRGHFIEVLLLLLIVVVPVFILTPWFAWHYRYRNSSATYSPRWSFSWPLEFVVWGVPFAIVIVLAVWLWKDTKALDPYAPISAARPPLRVDVVGYDWKWLFIYPDLKIATMGEFAFPFDRPLALDLTSDTVMQSFFIPALGSQIYAMAGMTTRLHLLADKTGSFRGVNTQYNGDGFYRQRFVARAMPAKDFAAWVRRVRESGAALSATAYHVIEQKSTVNEARKALNVDRMPKGVVYFSAVPSGLFQHIVQSFHGGPTNLTALFSTAAEDRKQD